MARAPSMVLGAEKGLNEEQLCQRLSFLSSETNETLRQSTGDLRQDPCASDFPSGQWEVAWRSPVLDPSEVNFSRTEGGTPHTPRAPTCMSRAWADDGEVAGSSPHPVPVSLGFCWCRSLFP